jgi:peptide deformylase
MSKLEIKKYGDPILRKKSELVLKIDKYIEELANNMLETMYEAFGMGLAAPQVGVSLRLCVIDVSQNKKSQIIMVNPQIISAENKVFAKEGCLSFPNFYDEIKRFEKIVVCYTDLNGKMKEIKAEGFLARAIQHEVDHLDGKLYIDYLSPSRRKDIEKEIKRKRKTGNW